MLRDHWSLSARLSLLLSAGAWTLWLLLAYLPTDNETVAVLYSLLALPVMGLVFVLASAGQLYGWVAFKSNKKHGLLGVALSGGWLIWALFGVRYTL